MDQSTRCSLKFPPQDSSLSRRLCRSPIVLTARAELPQAEGGWPVVSGLPGTCQHVGQVTRLTRRMVGSKCHAKSSNSSICPERAAEHRVLLPRLRVTPQGAGDDREPLLVVAFTDCA